VVLADLLDKLILRHGLSAVVYVKALSAEDGDGILANVLE
jgi:hypothetical protein